MASRILGFIVTTFLIAVIYGVFLTTMDFMKPNYDPVNSGHRAANNIYGFFGTADNEIKRNDARANTPVLYRIATPYAITADLSAIFGGKIEVGVSSMLHTAENSRHAQSSASTDQNL